MDKTIKGVCIFGHYRTGSTLLCEQIAGGLNRKYGLNAKPLYELAIGLDRNVNQMREILRYEQI